jgi:hypothetical protein
MLILSSTIVPSIDTKTYTFFLFDRQGRKSLATTSATLLAASTGTSMPASSGLPSACSSSMLTTLPKPLDAVDFVMGTRRGEKIEHRLMGKSGSEGRRCRDEDVN